MNFFYSLYLSAVMSDCICFFCLFHSVNIIYQEIKKYFCVYFVDYHLLSISCPDHLVAQWTKQYVTFRRETVSIVR